MTVSGLHLVEGRLRHVADDEMELAGVSASLIERADGPPPNSPTPITVPVSLFTVAERPVLRSL
jgi:hypothetical protein